MFESLRSYAWVWGSYGEVLKEPRSQDVGGHFGEDASLFVVQFVFVEVVVVACAGRRRAVIQTVTWSETGSF